MPAFADPPDSWRPGTIRCALQHLNATPRQGTDGFGSISAANTRFSAHSHFPSVAGTLKP